MPEVLASGSRRKLRMLDAAGPSRKTSSLDIVVGDCLRYLPERREVYAAGLAESEEDALVVKRFMPHPKMERDARREWDGLRFMREHGLPGPEPYGMASDEADGSLWVMMRQIKNLAPLEQVIEGAFLEESERRKIARQMVCAVQKMHSCAVLQTDQHAGNWGWDGEAVYLLDAGSLERRRSSLPEKARLSDLAQICVTLSPSMEREFRSQLRESSLTDWPRYERKLDRAVGRVQRARLRRYDKKTRRSCTEFQRVAQDGSLCLLDRQAEKGLLETFRRDPEALMADAHSLKAGNTCTVVRIEHRGRYYVLKRYNKKPFWHRLRARFKLSRAVRSWSSSWLLKMAFVPTPRAIGVYEEYSKGLRHRCYLLMEAVEGQGLDSYVAAHRDEPEKLVPVAAKFARIHSALARMRAAHGDFKASNFIVDPKGELYLFDLDVFAFNLPASIFRRRREKDWARLMKNWSGMPEVGRVFEKVVLEQEKGQAE